MRSIALLLISCGAALAQTWTYPIPYSGVSGPTFAGYVNGNFAYLNTNKAATTHTHTGVYAPLSHVHIIDDITGLQAALDAKQAAITGAPGTWPTTFLPSAPGASALGGVKSGQCTTTTGKLMGFDTSGDRICESDQTGADGGGITSLNLLTGSTQTLEVTNDTNVTGSWTSTGTSHTLVLNWTGALAKARQHANTLYTDSSAGSFPTLNQSTSGNAATATALAANGTNCSAGQHPLGVDASGNAEGCTADAAGSANSVFTGSTASTSSFSATPTFSLADVSVKSPLHFEPGALTANVTAVTFSNKTAGAKFSIAWLQDGTGGRTVAYGASASNTCTVDPTASITTIQRFIVKADGSTVIGDGCTTDQAGAIQSGPEMAAPGTPASSTGTWWFDSTNHVFSYKANGSSTVSNTVVPDTGASNNYISAISAAGVISKSRPSCSTLSDSTALCSTAPPTGAIVGTSDSQALTNKTLDAEGTGNAITIPFTLWLPGAGCNNATAASFWDLPTSTPAVATCVTGSNTQKGVLAYADTTGGFSAQSQYLLPDDWTGAIDAKILWSTSATSGNAKWSLSTICTATNAAETDDASFNTASTVTTAAPGTANRLQTSAITGVTATGCAAGEFLHVKLFRDGNDGSDTLGATANVVGVELKIRRTM